jgi:hypothetical protein
MNIYIFEKESYYGGLAVIVAESCARAIELAINEFAIASKDFTEEYCESLKKQFLAGTVRTFELPEVHEEEVVSFIWGSD